MPVPSYITDEYVFYSDITTPAALLWPGATNWLLPYEFAVDDRTQADLDLLVAANGGTLPLTSYDVAYDLMLDNGRSWYDTYIGITKYITPATLPTYAQFHNPSSGGGGGSYTLPPATATVLGGVKVPAGGGLDINAGVLSVDILDLPPSGLAGQVLTSVGPSGSPEWEDVDGGNY